MPDDPLQAQLRALGRVLDVPPSPDASTMAAKVRARLVAPPAAVRPRLVAPPAAVRPRLRYLAAAAVFACAVLVAGSPQLRAAVADFFRFAGVIVEPAAPPTTEGLGATTAATAPAPAPATTVGSVAAARAMVPFPVGVPAALGQPDEVVVVDGRVVSFTYRAAGIRLDQFDGVLDVTFAKQVSASAGVEWTQVDGADALWIPGPHELVYVDRAGVRHTEAARLAGSALVWQRGEVTYRLEGAFPMDRALAIARSVG